MATPPIGSATAVADDPTSTSVTYAPRLIRYTTAIILAAAPVVAAAPFFVDWSTLRRVDLLGIALFALAATIAESKPVPLDENGSRSVSLSFIFILAEQTLFGWTWGVAAAVACMTISQALERVELRRLLFNTGVYVLATALSALPGLAVAWDGGRMDAAHVGRLTATVFAGGAVFVLTNVLLVAIVAALAQGVTVRSMLDDYVSHAGPAFLVMGFIAALATALWRLSPVLELLLAGPLFALALAQRYAYRTVVATTAAETDGLTGLRNHRAFQDDLAGAMGEPGARGALVSMDIDDFKSINDRFGHPAGDEVLVQLADIVREHFGREASYRVGGEELTLLFQGRNAEEAREAVEALHTTLRATIFPHGDRVSMSVGVAAFPEMGTDRDRLLRAADSALYWAKNHGKARTCVFHPQLVPVLTRQQVADEAERLARLRAAESLIRIVDAKDTYTGRHSQSVSRLVGAIGRTMQLEEDVVDQLRIAGLLHDLGKIATPDGILRKPGDLDAEEEAVLRGHAELGFRLVEGLGVSPVDVWIRHHHEAWDGSGYPHGLAGDEIPLGSRIILVADAFDAMTTERAYRPGGSAEAAIAELRRCCWTQFDARVVAALEQCLGELPSPLAQSA
jgi:diguanylate cyclase (GGDEF)-like protein